MAYVPAKVVTYWIEVTGRDLNDRPVGIQFHARLPRGLNGARAFARSQPQIQSWKSISTIDVEDRTGG